MSKGVHIGELIRQKQKESGKTVVWFADKINCHRTNVYKIFAKPHLNSLQLALISSVLDYNFSSHYPDYKESDKKV
ncbi:MAG: XRE family transcriptional regulator [Prevotellaceae bacterium]|jgi:hypothetical protein|nr:XRE family transcriptional regulator [Prevotellaceae bacterium]